MQFDVFLTLHKSGYLNSTFLKYVRTNTEMGIKSYNLLFSRANGQLESYVYWTVHHCDSWRIKDQFDVTCYFISLLMCSTCFGH